MLIQVNVSNLVTIQELLLDFCSGTTVITGETGTGKSILIDAIELALGTRASENIIRPGQEKTDISLCFDTSKLPAACAWLRQHELTQETNECIIRRTINKDGRSRSYINGTPTTLQSLRELSGLLIDIHGQHEYQSLLSPEKQCEIVDNFAGHTQLIEQVKTIAQEWRTLNNEMIALKKSIAERNNRSEFLKFQLREIEDLALLPDELQTLDLEHTRLAHANELQQNISHSLACLTEQEEQNALRCLNQALHALEAIQHVDPKMTPWIESIKSIIIQTSDIEHELQRYLNNIDLDPERLTWIEQRLSLLFNLARKHKISPNELYDFQQTLAAELHKLENSDERLHAFSQQLHDLEKKYHHVAKKLSQSRMTAAKKLTINITALIRKLALPHAEFQVYFDQDNVTAFSPTGLEKIIFQIKTNAGQLMQPLAKIASGGELSRVSLAIYIATATQHTTPTLIFDEVDVGISGGTAEMVGKLLRRLGQTQQVLCITHLPQVAAQGHHHMLVAKINRENVTYTQIQTLSAIEKINEIARMLGGIEMTSKTLAHAKEMVEKVNRHVCTENNIA
ncbi:MAG: hypothetical protein ACD_45C00382G0004 [uncultured bacterium]|nr:MAG: hypothetical protein ACD_45C00382G0004 [uncultured bacterium]